MPNKKGGYGGEGAPLLGGVGASSTRRAAAPSGRLRGAALAVVFAAVCLLGYTSWILARPLYWKLYADVIHRYETDTTAQLIQELQRETETGLEQQQQQQQDLLLGRRSGLGGRLAPGDDGGGGGSSSSSSSSAAAAATTSAQQLVGDKTAGKASASEQQQPDAPRAQQQQQQQKSGDDDPALSAEGPDEENPDGDDGEEPGQAKPADNKQQQQQQQQPQQQQPSSQEKRPQKDKQQQQQPASADGKTAAAEEDGDGDAAAAAALPPAELERARARAREKQWEDEWWAQYQKAEKERKGREHKERREREARLIKRFNHTLTRDLVKSIAQDGYLVVTWANHHYTDFALTWVHHVQQAGIKGYMVGAMDEEILLALAKRSIHTFSMSSGLPTGDFGWGSKSFAKMGRKKISLIAKFLSLGVDVVISDVDVMWLRSPLNFFARFPDADVLTSSDHLAPTVGAEERLERYPDAGSAFNIGIMLFRGKSLPFVRQWIKVIEADDNIWDQNAFNDLIRAGQVIDPEDENNYFRGANGTLTVGVLPIAYFASGHVFFTQRLHDTLGVRPYAVHATFQFSGTPGKRHRMREAGLWLEDTKYYHPPGGFLLYEPKIPPALLERAGPRTGEADLANTEGHFALVNRQLAQLRSALAVATVLGRAVILPRLWCGMDRYWAPHAGVLPGSKFDLPFVCPADHVLDLEGGWTRDFDQNEFGPPIAFREYSFLNHTALPDSVRGSVVHVLPCKKGAVGCASGGNPATVEFNRLYLQEKLPSDKMAAALSSVAPVALLNFTDIEAAFGNFSRAADYVKFQKRLSHYGAVWCCADAHPGHVHYDFWWDVEHKDKFGRQWARGEWHPRAGP